MADIVSYSSLKLMDKWLKYITRSSEWMLKMGKMDQNNENIVDRFF